jgi:hypothetical protein
LDNFTSSNLCFEEIRERHFVYVDKTAHAHRLLTGNNTSFLLSRPRRFGKSLFLSTLKSALEGKSELSEGLALNPGNYDFERRPVIHLDLSTVDSSTFADMNAGINRLLEKNLRTQPDSSEIPERQRVRHRLPSRN